MMKNYFLYALILLSFSFFSSPESFSQNLQEEGSKPWKVLPTGKIVEAFSAQQEGLKAGSQWEFSQSMENERTDHFLIPYPDGRILVAGGYGVEGEQAVHYSDNVIYDPENGTWQNGPSLNIPRAGFCGILLQDGRAALVGGNNLEDRVVYNIEIFNPETDSFTLTSDMTEERMGFDAVELDDGRILVAGGTDGWGVFFNSSEIYSPETDSWEFVTEEFSEARSLGQLVKLDNGEVLYIGGVSDIGGFVTHNVVDIFDPEANKWRSGPSLNYERQQFSLVRLSDGRIMVMGGLSIQTGEKYTSTEIFDPVEKTWIMGPDMEVGHRDASAMTLPSGEVIIAGGQNCKNVEIFDPVENTWTLLPDLNEYRYWFGLALLKTGQLFSVGGSYGWTVIYNSAELLHLGYADVFADNDTLDFQQVQMGESSSLQLVLKNNGYSWAELKDVQFSSGDFSVSVDLPLNIKAGEELVIDVELSGDISAGEFQEILTAVVDQGDEVVELEVALIGDVVDTTGIPDLSDEDCELKVFPNPASCLMTVKAGQAIEKITIYDIRGAEVMDIEAGFVRNISLDVSKLKAGNYFVKVQDVNGLTSGETVIITR